MLRRAAIFVSVIAALAGCGSKGDKSSPPPARVRPALPSHDGAVSDASASDAGPENRGQGTGDRQQATSEGDPVVPRRPSCVAVLADGAALSAVVGKPVLVKAAPIDARRPLPPLCLLDGVGTVMVDCTVRAGYARLALARLVEHGGGQYSAMAPGTIGREAVAAPGQLVFVDADTECLVTVTAAGLDTAKLLGIAHLAEAGVTPDSAY